MPTLRLFMTFILCAGLSGAWGCKPASEAKVEKAPEAAVPNAPAPEGQSEDQEGDKAAALEDIQLDVLNFSETMALVKQYPGKVVVMDFWATYCPPCIEEFPNLVRLHKEHGDKIACISVSADYEGLDDQPVESYRPKVMKFLVKQGASIKNVLLSVSAENLFGKEIEHQSIPIVYVFDQKGELRGQFPDPKNPDEFTYQKNVIPLVQQLMKGE